VQHDNRGGQDGSRFEFLSEGGVGWSQVISKHGAPLADGFSGDPALIRPQVHAGKTVGQLSTGLFAPKFASRQTAPEVDPGEVEKLARGAAKELDQGTCMGAFRGLPGDAQQEFLKAVIGPESKAFFLGNQRTATGDSKPRAESR